MGYVHCNDAELCDIQCGEECKNGSRAAQCVENPCDVEPMCTEAVSCQMTTCDGECNTLFFDAAGAVVDCDSSTQPLEGNKMAPDANKDTIVDCFTTADCGMEEYCSYDAVCLKNGSCNLEEDCSTSDNLYAVAMCIGTVSCDMG